MKQMNDVQLVNLVIGCVNLGTCMMQIRDMGDIVLLEHNEVQYTIILPEEIDSYGGSILLKHENKPIPEKLDLLTAMSRKQLLESIIADLNETLEDSLLKQHIKNLLSQELTKRRNELDNLNKALKGIMITL